MYLNLPDAPDQEGGGKNGGAAAPNSAECGAGGLRDVCELFRQRFSRDPKGSAPNARFPFGSRLNGGAGRQGFGAGALLSGCPFSSTPPAATSTMCSGSRYFFATACTSSGVTASTALR